MGDHGKCATPAECLALHNLRPQCCPTWQWNLIGWLHRIHDIVEQNPALHWNAANDDCCFLDWLDLVNLVGMENPSQELEGVTCRASAATQDGAKKRSKSQRSQPKSKRYPSISMNSFIMFSTQPSISS